MYNIPKSNFALYYELYKHFFSCVFQVQPCPQPAQKHWCFFNCTIEENSVHTDSYLCVRVWGASPSHQHRRSRWPQQPHVGSFEVVWSLLPDNRVRPAVHLLKVQAYLVAALRTASIHPRNRIHVKHETNTRYESQLSCIVNIQTVIILCSYTVGASESSLVTFNHTATTGHCYQSYSRMWYFFCYGHSALCNSRRGTGDKTFQ